MRSQTLATMDESAFQRALAAQKAAMAPDGASLSSERLIDSQGEAKSDFAYYSELLPPELARQIMLGEQTRPR